MKPDCYDTDIRAVGTKLLIAIELNSQQAAKGVIAEVYNLIVGWGGAQLGLQLNNARVTHCSDDRITVDGRIAS